MAIIFPNRLVTPQNNMGKIFVSPKFIHIINGTDHQIDICKPSCIVAPPTAFQGKIRTPIIETNNPTGLLEGTNDLYNCGATTDGTHVFLMVWQEPDHSFVLKSTIQPDKSLGAWSHVLDYDKNCNSRVDWVNFGMHCFGGYLYAAERTYFDSAWHYRIWRAEILTGGALGAWVETVDMGNFDRPGSGFHGDRIHFVGGEAADHKWCRTYHVEADGSFTGEWYDQDFPYSAERRFVKSFGTGIASYGGNYGTPSFQKPHIGTVDEDGYVTVWTPNDGSLFGETFFETFYGTSEIIQSFVMFTCGFWGGYVEDESLTFQSREIGPTGNFLGDFNLQQLIAGPMEYVGPAVYTNTHWYMPLAQASGDDVDEYKSYYGEFY